MNYKNKTSRSNILQSVVERAPTCFSKFMKTEKNIAEVTLYSFHFFPITCITLLLYNALKISLKILNVYNKFAELKAKADTDQKLEIVLL